MGKIIEMLEKASFLKQKLSIKPFEGKMEAWKIFMDINKKLIEMKNRIVHYVNNIENITEKKQTFSVLCDASIEVATFVLQHAWGDSHELQPILIRKCKDQLSLQYSNEEIVRALIVLGYTENISNERFKGFLENPFIAERMHNALETGDSIISNKIRSILCEN